MAGIEFYADLAKLAKGDDDEQVKEILANLSIEDLAKVQLACNRIDRLARKAWKDARAKKYPKVII